MYIRSSHESMQTRRGSTSPWTHVALRSVAKLSEPATCLGAVGACFRAGTCASPSPTVQNRRTPRMCGTRTCALWPLFVVVPLWLWLCMCLCLCLCLLAIAVWLQLSWWVGDKGDGAGTTAWHAGRACSPWPHRSWPRHSNAAPPFDSPLARCRRHRHDRWCRRHSPNPARRLMVERCPTVNTTTTTSRTRLTRTREDLRVWHRRVAPLTVAWW